MIHEPPRTMEDIETKFVAFARARAVGDDPAAAARSGHFSAMPGQGAPDLFGTLDMLYAAHIVGRLDELTDASGREAWAGHILTYQQDDGWFRSGDTQSHGVEHATAYALGGLQILAANDRGGVVDGLKPLRGFKSEIVAAPDRSHKPFELSLLDRVHFWRGSHRTAGLAAIMGSVADLGLPAERFVGVASPRDWLDGWWDHFAARVDRRTGYWAMAPHPVHAAFDLVYRLRHEPRLASMGGAVHLYWISEKLSAPMPYPQALISATSRLIRASGLYEVEPYCIDLDANFLLARALPRLNGDDAPRETARRALLKNRAAVAAWFSERPADKWNANSHKLPGAFAAIAEADRVLAAPHKARWRDIFETTWWL
jgi:hypothetical protein